MLNLYNLFQEILHAKYTHLGEQTASYAISKEGGSLKIYFEWSNGCVDWRNNLDFPTKPYRDMQDGWLAHRGFLRVWRSVEDTLAPFILDPSVKEILIGGYSHGSALALFCHEYCVYHRPDIASEIYTYAFGAPRVVFGCVSKSVKQRFEKFYVVRNRGDIVTHLPPAIFGYRHMGHIYPIGKGDKNPVDSHRPENYEAALSEIYCEK